MRGIMKLFSSLLITLVLLVSFSSVVLAAVTTTVPVTSLSGYSSIYNDYTSWNVYTGITRPFTAAFTPNIPTGIKVTNARLYLYGYGKGFYDTSSYSPGSLIFFGLDLSGLPTWGWTRNPYGSYINSSEWKDFNITNIFSGYSGGVQTFYAQSSVLSTNPDWAVASVCCVHPNASSQITYRPYVQMTYSYVPTIPSISSPVAGSFNKSEIALSANSSVVGDGTINYYWEYSLDGATNWTPIFYGIATSYIWNIPEEISEDETIYVRCRAQHESVYSDYSAPIQFINGNEPAVAAKLAAEAAEAKAEEVHIALGEVDNRVKEIYNLLCLDSESPIITKFTHSIDKVRVVRNDIETFFIVVKDNVTPIEQLRYRYRINSGEYSNWKVLNGSFFPINLGTSAGYKQILVEVQDLAANIAISRLGIFKY